jgi:hypothetical protein
MSSKTPEQLRAEQRAREKLLPPTSDMTTDEFSDTITGVEEEIINRHFGVDWTALPENRPTMFLRAMVTVDKIRAGGKPGDAKKAAMDLTLLEVNSYFTPDPEDVDSEDPDSDSGKDDWPPDELPSSSPDSA